MTHVLNVRDATVGERPEVAEVTRRAYLEFAQSSDPAFWAGYEASTREVLLEDDQSRRVVVTMDDRIVATVLYCAPREGLFNKVWNPFPEMRLLAVLPQCRDRQLGALLITTCEKRARDEGFAAITLHTTVLMQTAKSMYERRGYVRFPELDFEPAPGFVVWGYTKQLP
jgi:ribosomal protein S18 acetylase RimI-like enzyme